MGLLLPPATTNALHQIVMQAVWGLPFRGTAGHTQVPRAMQGKAKAWHSKMQAQNVCHATPCPPPGSH